MKKIKVLQFPIANSYGGITHYALNNWKLIDKEKFHFDFATMSKKLDFADEILETGSKIHYISCYAEDDEQKFIEQINEILDEGYDIVHLHTKQWKSFLVEKICLERNVPKVIVHSHATKCDANDPIKRQLETVEHNRVKQEFNESLATDFWACSEEAADWLFGTQISRDKICVLNNAIEVGKFAYDADVRKRVRTKMNIDDYFVIGNVGRLVYQKNQTFLLDVFAEVYKRDPHVILLLVGEGELRQELYEQAKLLGIAENVLFLGKREDTHELYQAMDLLVLPSIFEGLALCLIEAQTSGLRCLVSQNVTKAANVTGKLEYLEFDKVQWAEKILEYKQGYERRDCSDIVTEKGFSLREQIKVVEKLYLAGYENE